MGKKPPLRLMATFGMVFSARDIWLLQQFTECHLATEETLSDRICVWICGGDIWTDGGNVRIGRYSHLSGLVRWRSNYKRGKRHGLTEIWNHFGVMLQRVNYKDGENHGLDERWYETGKIMSVISYQNGKRHGCSEGWSVTGRQLWRGHYKDGMLHGLYETWNMEGVLQNGVNCQDGKCVS